MLPARHLATMLAIVAVGATGCTSDGADEPTDETAPDLPTVTVEVPAARSSPFCEAMTELTDQVRAGALDDVEGAILETYRSVSDVVPPEIAADFALVLAALESGGPLPTDPPRDTVATTPPSTVESTVAPSPESTADESEPATSTSPPPERQPDPGIAPSDSPAERVNAYIDFTCRNSANNPGPPATQPGGDAVVDTG